MKSWANISSIGHFLETVAFISEGWGRKDADELWFRAEDERHHSTRLLPGLYRPRGGTETRRPVQDLLGLELRFYEEFGRCAGQLSVSDVAATDGDWDPYFLMQHYGVPTRLLDWTDGALVALHFAIRDKPLIPTSDSIVFVMDPYWLIDLLDNHRDRAISIGRWKKYCRSKAGKDKDEDDWDRLYLPFGEDDPDQPLINMPSIPLLWDSPHLTRRVAAQRSRFLIFGTDPDFLADMQNSEESRLDAIQIPKESIPRLRRELRDTGVTESVVYPDLDGLGRELKMQWELER